MTENNSMNKLDSIWSNGILYLKDINETFHCLFSKDRIHFIELPNGFYKYELAEIGGDKIPKIEIKSKVFDNFFGTIIIDRELNEISDLSFIDNRSNGIFPIRGVIVNQPLNNYLSAYNKNIRFYSWPIKEVVS